MSIRGWGILSMVAGILVVLPSIGLAQRASLCVYPSHPRRRGTAQARARQFAALALVNEQEPNDSAAQSQAIPLGGGPGQDRDVNISGDIGAGDVDYFRFTGAKGDVIGMACLSQSQLDPMLAVCQSDGTFIAGNDDDPAVTGSMSILPPSSPFPEGANQGDSAFQWVVPGNQDFLIRVNASSGTGTYTLVIVNRRPSFEAQLAGRQQIVFLDFDGATINAQQIFGRGNANAALSPLADFLDGWTGITRADESAVIDAIITTVRENFDDLRLPTLNGDRDTDGIHGHFDVEIRNSRDHPDPFGQPNVSRAIVGGTQAQFGVSTIGLAQSLDPGNYAREDTCVILLDDLTDPTWGLNSIQRDPGATMLQLIGVAVGNIVSHEIGHYLGLFHCDPFNASPTLIDSGAGGLGNLIGTGTDGIFGNGDDADVDYTPDDYYASETIATGTERCDTRVAFALATGTEITVESMTIGRSYVRGGQSTNGRVVLNAPAGTGGLTVQLVSARPNAVSVQASVFVPAGQTSANFAIDTQPLPKAEDVLITASASGYSVSESLRVNIGGSDGGGGGGGGGGCFIATAAYGTALDPRIQFLSAIRDQRLLSTRLGRDLTNTYYANSPTCARHLRGSDALRALVRRLIRPAADSAAAMHESHKH